MAAPGQELQDVLRPRSVDEAREMIAQTASLVPRGGGTKWGLADPGDGARVMDVRAIAGIVDYDPSEFTVTARAGTPLAELAATLARHGQYLPFDPPFVSAGATLGGAIASGLAGPGRLRWGGVRDFVLGVRFVDGQARLVRGGGKVVKNAAGFDLPKLLCGSRGRLGLIVEATLKVFPAPRAFGTLAVRFSGFGEALAGLRLLSRSPLEPFALDLVAPAEAGAPCTLLVRGAGPEVALDSWLGRAEAALGRRGERLAGEAERRLWDDLRDLRWAGAAAAVLRIHTVPSMLESLEALLGTLGARRHYSVAGNVAWVALERVPDWDQLARRLGALGAPTMVLRGAPPGRCWLVTPPGEAFARRVKQAVDPDGRFGRL